MQRVAAALLVFAIGAVPSALGAQQRVEIRRAATPSVAVRLNGAFGQLRIIGWKHDSIALTGTLPSGARLDGGIGAPAAAVPGAKFWIEPSPTDPTGGALELCVPVNARVWVKTSSAAITAEDVTGSLDLNIVTGSLVVRGNPREAPLESMDGTVTVDGAPNWMRIRSADGNITVRGAVSDLGITTVSGRVTITDGTVERARIESVTGPVTFASALARGAALMIDSHSGAIAFSTPVPANLSADVRTLTGRIDNMLNSRRPSPGRDGRGEELTLELGLGGAQATLRSFKGSIRLTSR